MRTNHIGGRHIYFVNDFYTIITFVCFFYAYIDEAIFGGYIVGNSD